MTKDELRLGVILATQLPLMTAPQAEAAGLAAAARRLARRGVIQCRVEALRAVRPGPEPLLAHRPGDWLDWETAKEVSLRAKARTHAAQARPAAVYRAGHAAAALWGDKTAGHGNPFSGAHDHVLAEVWLALSPADRGRFRYEPDPEGRVREKFQKVPDAALVGGDGRPTLWIEVVGAGYPPERVRDLARHADETNVNILMW